MNNTNGTTPATPTTPPTSPTPDLRAPADLADLPDALDATDVSVSPPPADALQQDAPRQVASRTGRSIREFLTDGSLAGVCKELSSLVGITIELRDEQDHPIIRRAPGEHGAAWRILDEAEPVPDGSDRVPLVVAGRTIGTLVLHPGEPDLGPDARQRTKSAMMLLAAAASELCEQELELWHREKEVELMFHLSSMLVRAGSVDKLLSAALRSAIDVMELDAGSIVLLDEDAEGVTSDSEEDLVLKASEGLSDEWLHSPIPLSKFRVFDRMALDGDLVVIEDLQNDSRVLLPERAEREGLRGCINAGLVFRGRPIGVIRLYSRTPRLFTDADTRLIRSIAQQAAVAVEQARLLELQEKEQRTQRQLELAADVQQRMLPRAKPDIPEFDIAARYLPSLGVGGDFYDLFELEGSLALVVGDVVGKGIAAGLLMSSVRASLRAHAQNVYDLNEVISRVNVALSRDTLDNEFATIWYGVIDPRTRRLTYCSAGHEPTMVVRVPEHRAPTTADIDELSVGGMVVGIDPSQRFQRAVYDLMPGDVLIAYTDGLTDVMNFEGQRFGRKRVHNAVLNVLQAQPDTSAEGILEHILWEVRQFSGLKARPDDQTIVVVRLAR